jgi:two-component system chemotaxis response regulator CheB
MRQIIEPLRVYVVEDSPIIQRLLASKIEAADAKLLGQSADAKTAIAELAMLQPDLVVVDIALEDGNGFDVLRAIQGCGLVPGAVKVVLTNHANAEYEKLSARLGAHRFFDKASEMSQLLALVDALAVEKKRLGTNSPKPDPVGNRTRN